MSDILIEPEPVSRTGQSLTLKEGSLGAMTPRPTDVVQGEIGNCPIAAVMVAVAHTRPDLITKMIGSPRKGPILSKREGDDIFNLWSDQYLAITFPGQQAVEVTPFVYFDGDAVKYASTPNGPGWPSYIEKAYAVFKSRGGFGQGGSYTRLEERRIVEPPKLDEVMRDLIGQIDILHFVDSALKPLGTALEDSEIIAWARRANRRPTVAATIDDSNIRRFRLIERHGFAVLGVTDAGMRVRNPWGGTDAEAVIPISHCRRSFHGLFQAR